MSRSRIDGSGTNETPYSRKTLSKRAMIGSLSVEKGKCISCGHKKIFRGNPGGHNIVKCCKCKVYQK